MLLGSASMASRMMWLSALGTPAAGSSSSSTSRLEAERDGELDQALPAVGQFGDGAVRRRRRACSVSSKCIASSITSRAHAGGPKHVGAAPTRSATAM